jgi:transposase
MRYPDGDGLTAAGRARREKVRLQAAQLFEQDMPPVQVAHQLWVSTKSAYQWRRCWRVGGAAALASKGAGGAVCRLSAGQLARLRGELDKGPAVHGLDEDQRWTLERVATLIGRLFHVRYTFRPGLIDGFLAQTGLSIKPQPPQTQPEPDLSGSVAPFGSPRAGLCRRARARADRPGGGNVL